MKIEKAKSAGFCFGVRRAIRMALDLAEKRPMQVCMLGDIVHNEDVIRELEKAGIRNLKKLGNGRGKTLLIRAHGAPRRLIESARARGYSIADATCPMVREIHCKAVKMERSGRAIIIIGDPGHDEVKGILGRLRGKAVVVSGPGDIPGTAKSLPRRAGVVVQSTQNMETVRRLVGLLRSAIPDMKFCDTICKPTRMKQAEVRRMPARNDVMIVIGSGGSANTRRLYEISRGINPRSYRIASAGELRSEWFAGARSVGVTAGASTPDRVIDSVVKGITALI